MEKHKAYTDTATFGNASRRRAADQAHRRDAAYENEAGTQQPLLLLSETGCRCVRLAQAKSGRYSKAWMAVYRPHLLLDILRLLAPTFPKEESRRCQRQRRHQAADEAHLSQTRQRQRKIITCRKWLTFLTRSASFMCESRATPRGFFLLTYTLSRLKTGVCARCSAWRTKCLLLAFSIKAPVIVPRIAVTRGEVYLNRQSSKLLLRTLTLRRLLSRNTKQSYPRRL